MSPAGETKRELNRMFGDYPLDVRQHINALRGLKKEMEAVGREEAERRHLYEYANMEREYLRLKGYGGAT